MIPAESARAPLRRAGRSTKEAALGLASNLFRLFRENSDVVPVSRLQKQGVRSVTVLDWRKVEELLAKAVDEALAKHGVELSPEALKSVNREAKEAFARLVEQRDTFRESAETLEREKGELAKNAEILRQELERARQSLAGERTRPISAADVELDQAGMDHYMARLGRELKELLAGGDGAARGGSTADAVAALARKLLDDERGRALDAARSEQRQRIELLERRIAKLQGTLTETESVVDRLRKEKGIEPGIESIYREVQGLDAADGKAEAKRGLLDEIFRLNVELRAVIDEAGGEKK